MPKERETAKIFLSYARDDERQVQDLYNQLKGAGYRPWLDKYDLVAGQRWREAIKTAIKDCDFFLACLSGHSTNKSGDIQREIKMALDHLEEACEGEIYLIPVRLEEVDIPDRLSEIQWVDLFHEDGWRRLIDAIQSQGFPGVDKAPTPTRDRWSKVYQIRQPIMDLVTPTYILDDTYHILDWNPAFDEIVAKQAGLSRGAHGLEFIRKLDNFEDVIERSKKVFGRGEDPLVDIEILQFTTEDYGLVLFQKIASRISNEEDNPLAWCVNLNIMVAEHLETLWHDLEKRLEHEINWTRYSISYDKLLQPFDEYGNLVTQVVDLVGDARRCIDIGAATGNCTRQLLDGDRDREVWAVEPNEAMLRHLREKVKDLDKAGSATDSVELRSLDYLDRLTIVKEDAQRMDGVPANYFDAGTMINVLYAVDDPQSCLRQVHRVLRPGGVLVLSTPYQGTDVERLFGRLREVLEQKGVFQDLKSNYEGAKRTHDKLDAKIHRDSLENIREYLDVAGFEIGDDANDWREGEYVGSVVVVRARKRA